jgi:hypothetical protein
LKQRLRKLVRKYFYSDETYNILNYATLEIEDKEIAKEYELYRIKRFNSMFWPIVTIFMYFNVFNWINYFSKGSELASALRPLHLVIAIIIMAIPRYCCNRYSPQSWILS